MGGIRDPFWCIFPINPWRWPDQIKDLKCRLGTTRGFNVGCVGVVARRWHGRGCGQVDGRIDNDGVVVAHGAL